LGTDVVEDACQTVSRLELIGEFAPTEPGAFYLSLGAVSVGSVQFNEAEVSLPSTGYQVHGQLPIVEVEQLSSEEALNRAVEICVRENAGDSRVPWNEPKVYRQLERDICAAALRFGISPILLAALLQHEGSGRTRWIQGSADKWIEENVNPFGQNETIGPAQMRPDLAVELSRVIDGRSLGEDEARDMLAHDSVFAVNMAAAELATLQARHGLDDRQTFIAYAGGAALVPEFKRTNFSGPDAKPRGEKYDELYGEIAGEAGFPLPAQESTW